MALTERQPQSFSQEPDHEQEITLFVGEDHHPVSMACYEKERFYIGGLRANLATVEEETITFAVTVETEQDKWTTLHYDLTGEQFYYLLHGNEPVGFGYIGMLEATRLAPPQEHEH